MRTSALARAAKKALAVRLQRMGFAKAERDGVYRRSLPDECVVYVMCRPRVRWGEVVLQPLIAIENFALRRIIGEDEPRQSEARIAHAFLSYTIGSGMISWRFSDELQMGVALNEIEHALLNGAIPFAERWTPFPAAVELLRRGFAGDEPWGVITHPPRASREIIEKLSKEGRHH